MGFCGDTSVASFRDGWQRGSGCQSCRTCTPSWEPVSRSTPSSSRTQWRGPILSVIYGGETAHDWGKLIRGFHVGIKGTDRYGRSYSALNPGTFFWAHATFVEDIITGLALIGFPLSKADTEALYLESIDWYRLFGVSMKPVPPDWAGFQQYWEYMVEN